MLPAPHRLVSRRAFDAAVRHGRRAGSRCLVVHLLVPDDGRPGAAPAQVGLVVGRRVGSAVCRNRVKRRLRHLAHDRLAELPPGSALVVRALPEAGEVTFARLEADLDRCLDRCLPRVAAPASARPPDPDDGMGRR